MSQNGETWWLETQVESLKEDLSNFKKVTNEKFEQVREEFKEMRKEQIDLMRQNHKCCVVLSGNSIRFQKNERNAFIGLCKKAFGIKIGVFELQTVHWLTSKDKNKPPKLIAKFKRTSRNSGFW